MPEQPIVPAPGDPIRNLNVPVTTEGLWVERVSTTATGYTPLKRGTLYSTVTGARQEIIDQFPNGLYFLREDKDLQYVRNAFSSEWSFRWYSTVPLSEDTYNAEINYLNDSISHGAYIRNYKIRRSVYETTPTIALGSPLTALIAIKVTAGGTGYPSTTTIAITGGGGSGAVAVPVISGGVITHVIVTVEGTGYTTVPTVTATGTGGAGATLVGVIQPQTAILTSQKKVELPENDPYAQEFVRVSRVYETLPGAWINFTRYDDNLGPIQGKRRLVVYVAQTASLTSTVKTTYDARDESYYVAWEIVETNSDGTGGAGNPAYPILIADFYDDERGAVQSQSQLVAKTGTEVGSLTESGGTITRISYEPFNEFLLKKVTETWLAAGPSLVTQSIGQGNLIPEKYRRLIRNVETNQLVDKDYTFPTGLTGDQAQVSLAQLNIQQARLKVIEEIIESSEESLVGGETGEYGPMVINESIVEEGDPIDTGPLVRDSRVTALGNGKAIKITVRFPEDLADLELVDQSIGQDDLTPAKYRRLITTQTTRKLVDSTYVFPSSLSGDEAEITLQWETIERARLKIVEEIVESEDTQLSGQEFDKWGKLTIVETVVEDGTAIDEGFLVKASSVTPFGNGKSLKIVISYPADLADVRLLGQELDRRLNIAFPTVQRIAAAGAEIGDEGKDIQPIDTERSLITEVDTDAVASLIDTYVLIYPGTANLQFPDVLESVTGIIESTLGEGEYDETGDTAIANKGSVGLSLRGTGQSSAAILPDVNINIRQIWARNVPITHYMFFLPLPVAAADVTAKLTELIGTSVSAWPSFNPIAHTITLVGQRLSLQVQANIQFSAGLNGADASLSTSEGTGYSKEVGLTLRTVRIPPTIHALITLTGDLTSSEFLSAYADVEQTGDVELHATRTEEGEVEASISPTSLAATTGDTSVPASGLRILNIDADPWQYGYARIHCEVVDFADV